MAMTPTNNSPVDTAADAAKCLGDKISDAASQVKSKVSDLGRTAVDKIDETRTAAATGLDNTASALHAGGEKVTGLAHTTADKLSSTATYLRNHDAKSMMDDVGRMVRRNPGPSLIAAGLIGFLVGRSLSRNSS
jgi:ElaB/YqjD/DUF883 family membrane-anchored ribosome-binding protein